jgi:hypothetical protein
LTFIHKTTVRRKVQSWHLSFPSLCWEVDVSWFSFGYLVKRFNAGTVKRLSKSHNRPVTARPVPQREVSSQDFALLLNCIQKFHLWCCLVAAVVHIQSLRSQIRV